jgi:hypothetical protein
MWKLALLLVALAVPFAPAAAAKPRTLAPVDQSAKDPQLAELIAVLVKACEEKDFRPFEAAISPDAIAGFDGSEGVAGFKAAYGIDDPATTFYADFKAAVTLGGAYLDETTYGAPYTYAAWPEDIDSFEFTAAVGDKTSLYAKPSDDSRVLADVTHQFLQVIEEEPDATGAAPEGWIHVTANGRHGYVKRSETRSPLDFRAVFQKTANRWWLGAFVAGD